MKTALLTGITGQDGILLSKLLISQNYRVIGITSGFNKGRVDLFRKVNPTAILLNGDFTSPNLLREVIHNYRPNEIYNLAAVSSVAKSFLEPELTFQINYHALVNLLAIVYQNESNQDIRFYQSSSSEMFGDSGNESITENSKLNPVSPYGESKANAHEYAKEFALKNGFFIAQGITFNHESEFRQSGFVSRKIIDGITAIKMGLASSMELGDLSPKRDWGYAGDFVKAMHSILQADKPDEFVIATGESHSIRDFVQETIKCTGLKGEVEEYVNSNTSLVRKSEIYASIGDFTKARNLLKWQPTHTFPSLVNLLVEKKMESLISGNIFPS